MNTDYILMPLQSTREYRASSGHSDVTCFFVKSSLAELWHGRRCKFHFGQTGLGMSSSIPFMTLHFRYAADAIQSNCFRFEFPAEAFGARRLRGRAVQRLRIVPLEIEEHEIRFASRYPTSPSGCRSIGRWLDRFIALSLGR